MDRGARAAAGRRGMTPDEDAPLMCATSPPAAPVPEELTVRRLAAEEAAVHIQVAAAGFDAPVAVFEPLVTARLLRTHGVSVYVGEVDGEAVVTGMSVVVGAGVAIANVATLPGRRRRGYGAALTARACADGLAAGAWYAWLQATGMAERVYAGWASAPSSAGAAGSKSRRDAAPRAMTAAELRARRAAAQGLHPAVGGGPEAVVARLLAVQAQDYRAARLAVRARAPGGPPAAAVDAALTAGRSLVIAWLMRGTLHLVGREDHAWLLALTAPGQGDRRAPPARAARPHARPPRTGRSRRSKRRSPRTGRSPAPR